MGIPRHLGGGTTRRGFLISSGALATGTALAAAGCSGSSAGSADADRMKIPDAKVKLPKNDVKLRLMDSGDTKAPFWKDFIAAYQKKHGNISATYDPLPWNRIQEVVPLGIRNGTAHDIFQLPPTIPIAQAVAEKWVAPLNDVVPDFEAWKASFPEGTFVAGWHVFDGKVYQVPLTSDQRHYVLLHYNKRLLDQAGFDPESEPLTWDTYREAARKVTKKGGGRAYGVVFEIAQPDRLGLWVQYMAGAAGAASVNYVPHGFINPENGEFFYTEDGVVEAVELMLALKKDGSVFPGSNSMAAPQTWPRVPRGNAAMVSAGPWVAQQWLHDNPTFDFGVAGHPEPGGGSAIPPNYPLYGTDPVVVFAKTKVKPVTGDVLAYVTSRAGQDVWGDIVGVGNPPINETARKALQKDAKPQAKQCLKVAESMVARPEPMVRNPQLYRAAQEQKALTPNFGAVIQALYLGKTSDVRKELKSLKDRSDRLFDQAIAAAKKKGAKVSRADFVFSNWDPGKDYSASDYKDL
jgi:multiple sugar transport system substrate-binding protein